MAFPFVLWDIPMIKPSPAFVKPVLALAKLGPALVKTAFALAKPGDGLISQSVP
ncbi:MAG: hypothetical protein LBP88_06345 [Treponema sp.]|nr:hypothetical protein [Treponema sp.]